MLGTRMGRSRPETGGSGTEIRRASKIVIVEDEIIVAWNLSETLERLGYDVTGVAHNAEDAVELVGRYRPDLVLMDIRLAGERDGIEAAGDIRQQFNLPVIFLSSHGDAYTMRRAAHVYPLGFIDKPYSEQGLAQALKDIVARASGGKPQ